jgi:hypothetical protein
MLTMMYVFGFSRLTLTYSSDERAMYQCIDALVFMRTDVKHRRVKIYLPQSRLRLSFILEW